MANVVQQSDVANANSGDRSQLLVSNEYLFQGQVPPGLEHPLLVPRAFARLYYDWIELNFYRFFED